MEIPRFPLLQCARGNSADEKDGGDSIMEALREHADGRFGGSEWQATTTVTTAGRKRTRDDTTSEFAWETSKENVMPLKRGRNVLELNKALRTNGSFQEKLKVEKLAQDMEAKIRAYVGDDPLHEWVQYIRWIEIHLPEDTRKKFSVLEKCTRVLKEESRYKDDIRYVRLWIQYVSTSCVGAQELFSSDIDRVLVCVGGPGLQPERHFQVLVPKQNWRARRVVLRRLGVGT